MRGDTKTESAQHSAGSKPEAGAGAQTMKQEGKILVEAIHPMSTIPNPTLLRRLKPVNPARVDDKCDPRSSIFRLVPGERYWFDGTAEEIETKNSMTHLTRPGQPCGLATLFKVVKESK